MEQREQITVNLKQVFRDAVAPLSFVPRHELLPALDGCINSTPENRLIRRRRLDRVCRMARLDPEQLLRDPAMLDQLPTLEQVLTVQLPDAFYSLYKAAPTSADYMTRLVRQLAPEYGADPVRLAILKKSVVALGENCRTLPTQAVVHWAENRLNERGIAPAAAPAARLAQLADCLDDSIFEKLNQTVVLMPADVLRCMATRLAKDRAAGLLPGDDLPGVDAACLAPLLEQCPPPAGPSLPDRLAALVQGMNAGTPDAKAVNAALDGEVFEAFRKEFAAALQRFPAKKEKKNPADTLRAMASRLARAQQQGLVQNGEVPGVNAACLAPLLAQCGVPEGASLAERLTALVCAMDGGTLPRHKVCAALDGAAFEAVRRQFDTALYMVPEDGPCSVKNSLFPRYKDNLKDARAALQNARGAAENWALLEFADDMAGGWFRPGGVTLQRLYCFAYVFGLRTGEDVDAQHDLEKNLFEDYYAENTLQLLKRDKATKATSLETITSVISNGINWKNYAEVCYLYWLRPRLDEAGRPIPAGRRLDKAQEMIERCRRAAAGKGGNVRSAPTQHTRTAVYRDEAAVVLELPENEAVEYLAERYIIRAAGPRLQAAADTNTAFEIADAARFVLEEEYRYRAPDAAGEQQETDDLSDGFLLPEVRGVTTRLHDLLTARYAQDGDFCRLVDALDAQLAIPVSVAAPENLRRMLALLYTLGKADRPLSTESLNDRLKQCGVAVGGSATLNAIKTLTELGFAVEQNRRQTKTHYSLAAPEADGELSGLLEQLLAKPVFDARPADEQALLTLVRTRIPPQRRISRTTFAALFTFRYIAENDLQAARLTDLMQAFRRQINEALADARYQKLGSKNLFDVYLLLLLFLYAAQDEGTGAAVYRVPVRYRLGGGVNAPQNPDSHVIGQALTLAPPTRPGYVFVGWQGGQSPEPEPCLTLAPYDFMHRTLTAVWKKPE